MSHEPPPTTPRDADRLIYAGLLGLSATSVVEQTGRETLSHGQEMSLYAFAFAIPLLAVGLVTDYARRAGRHIEQWRDLVGLVGAVAAVAGFGCLFFHFGIAIGVTFVVSCALGILLMRSA